ncbi:substrate-binding periplasmic protein [Vibrio marisflavi]|uniref:Solute-binding protein family 3/N-terminal domain-containing protein n=1 Tax=Vibrio marisflavi CECT 7928 TaxID=634439 RepID=A0ABN8E3Q9_9VIBR|nr:transporter substrate-binding domain-containing protein [Vibrio marisflavi]CAH0537591.1 hypothetical protein VMF7928_01188 [Vibrio marisflavi CECT 7928]
MRLVFCALFFVASFVKAETFVAHCRDRPPELVPTNPGCSGPIAEIIETAVGKLGHEVEWHLVPWIRTIKIAEYGDVDIIPRHSMNDKRSEFLYPATYGYETCNVYYMVNSDSQIKIERFEDLVGLIVGARRGSFYSKTFNESTELTKRFYNSDEQLLLLLKAQRIDVAIVSSGQNEETYRNEPIIHQVKYIDTFYNGRHISIPKKSPMAKYQAEFIQIIDEMRTSGEVNAIFQKYNVPPPVQYKE